MNQLYSYNTKEPYNKNTELYRYVPIDQFSLKSLNMGELFLNNLENMNDIHEMEPYFNIEAQNRAFEEVMQLSEELKNDPDTMDYLKKLNEKVFYIAKEDERDWVKRYVRGFEENNFVILQQLHYDIMEFMKLKTNIVCLSENPSSNVMWGNYANNHEGMMLEYDVCEIKKNCHNDTWMHSVQYFNNKHNAINFFHAFMCSYVTLDCEEIDDFIKTTYQMNRTNGFANFLFSKSLEWSYEKEVRISAIWSNNPRVIKVKPKSVTLGVRINPANREHIIHICRQNNIKVYEAYKDSTCPSHEIKRMEINGN